MKLIRDLERTVVTVAMTSTPGLHFVTITRCTFDNIGNLSRGLWDGDCGWHDGDVEIVWVCVDGPGFWKCYAS